MKPFLQVVSVLMVLLAAAWLVAPAEMLSSWGAHSDPVGLYMSRRYGAMFIGYAVTFWLARDANKNSVMSAILCGGAVVASLMTAITLFGVVGGTILGPAAWAVVAVEGGLAVGFLYVYLAVGRTNAADTLIVTDEFGFVNSPTCWSRMVCHEACGRRAGLGCPR